MTNTWGDDEDQVNVGGAGANYRTGKTLGKLKYK